MKALPQEKWYNDNLGVKKMAHILTASRIMDTAQLEEFGQERFVIELES